MKLSICIPTYNRKEYLEKLLINIEEEITEEIKKDVEVCINDNYSNDGTEELVRYYATKLKIKYRKNDKNLGADLNYLKVVELATGEYCWFIGSDDLIIKNKLKEVLEYIEKNKKINIFLGNRIECNIDMVPKLTRRWLKKTINSDKIYDFEIKTESLSYLKENTSLGGLFSYLSSIIFKTEEWRKFNYDYDYVGTMYIHVDILLRLLMQNKSKILYIYEPVVLCRGENDSFLENYKQRIFLDYKGYLKLSELIKDKRLKKEFLLVMKREHPYRHLIVLASLFKLTQEEKKILSKYSYNIIILNLLFNNFSHQILKRLYGGYKKLKNAKTSEK